MKRIFLLLLSFFCFAQGVVFAATPPPVSGGGILPGPSTEEVKSDSFGAGVENKGGQTYIIKKFIPRAVSGFVITIVSIGVIMLIIAGLVYVFSAGDSETIKKAKDIVFWTVVGVGVALVSFSLVQIIIGLNFTTTPTS